MAALLLILALVLGVPPAAMAAEPHDDAEAESTGAETDRMAELEAQVEALGVQIEHLRDEVAGLKEIVSSRRAALHTYRVPDSVTFADHQVPLDRPDVVERLEREFYVALGDPAQVILWLKRSARYFPYIEQELRKAGLPDDLKYVAVIESALRPRAYSHARASGIWQFIASTARLFGLRVTASWDDRRDPERSTAAAIRYLRELHQQFGDWPLALAGYNTGGDRVAAALKRQGVGEYYHVALSPETEAYFFRVLAAKLILEHPGRYGFEVPPEARYSPHAAELVKIHVPRRMAVRELAEAAGSYYRQIRALNPAIMRDTLPPGQYQVRIPEGRPARFLANLAERNRAARERSSWRHRYRVRAGDTLASIARRFGVSVSAIKADNPAARRPHIYPGDVLVIEPVGRGGPDS
ncbi:MAG TPA: transglycosylase SLT domain-containing protein [Methylomirabilota bacterium]|nr:transglycosylase SLT domain-containing protein [Methylomirabilota bacterium]